MKLKTSSNQRLWKCVRCRINVYPDTLNDFPSWLSTSKNQPCFKWPQRYLCKMQSQPCSFPSKVSQFSHCRHCIVSLHWRRGIPRYFNPQQPKWFLWHFMIKYVNYPSLITRSFLSQLQVDFSIIAVDVLDRQSLGVRFKTPNFFSIMAIVSLNIQSLFGP